MFIQRHVEANIKENTKYLHYWPFVRESTDHVAMLGLLNQLMDKKFVENTPISCAAPIDVGTSPNIT